MTQQQEQLLQKKFKKELQEARFKGMKMGVVAISAAIHEKVNSVDRTYTKNDLLRVIKDIKSYCEKGLNSDKK